MVAEQLKRWVAEKEGEIVSLLDRVVSIQSGSANVPGVNEVQRVLRGALEELGFDVTLHPAPGYGDHLLARRARPGKRRVVLDGHVDTVFPADSSTGFRREGDLCFGQGVMDMKGGVVCSLYALKALEDLGLIEELDLTVLLVSEEEVGSPTCRVLIEQLAKEVDLTLVFEESGKAFEVVVERRGVAEFVLEVEGKAGHSANVLVDRRNAIEEIAYKIVELRGIALEYSTRGVLWNVGVIEGGIAPNVIAERAKCVINVRYSDYEVYLELVRRMRECVGTAVIPGAKATLHEGTAQMPPMARSEGSLAAARILQEAVRELGREVALQSRAGGSNANLWSFYGGNVLDGLGPIGGDDHSDREWMDIPSLLERITHTALFLIRYSERSGE
jgi:glutamate carboxypeptidase